MGRNMARDDMDTDTSMDDADLATLFDGDGSMAIPTMRGNANLDVEDYQGPGRSSILDDEIQEDTPSRPGDGAGPATDIDMSQLDLLAVQDGEGMEQTDFGSSPWGPGSGQGYRSFSQQQTDVNLGSDQSTTVKSVPTDTMLYEPEVTAPVPWPMRNPQMNQQTSNRGVDPLTVYDRDSYEYDDSSQNVIGNGIYDEEEGVTWRNQDGIFAHQFALPAYIADEAELGVQQSEMWDTTADEWRVTQPSAGGVALSARVDAYRPPPSNSKIESFGWNIANALVKESKGMQRQWRDQFLARAMDSLGPGLSKKCSRVAQKLIAMGYPPEKAIAHVMAHCVMHATMDDLVSRQRRGGKGGLRRISNLAAAAPQTPVTELATKIVAPVAASQAALTTEISALKASPTAVQGMGQVAQDTASAPVPAAMIPANGVFTGKNMLIAGGVGLGAFLLWRNRKSLKKNAKKFARKVGL
jgi:hypothetical protein